MHLNYHLQSHINRLYYPLNLPKNQLNYNNKEFFLRSFSTVAFANWSQISSGKSIFCYNLKRGPRTTEQNDLFIELNVNQLEEKWARAPERENVMPTNNRQTTIIDTKFYFRFIYFINK